MSAKKGDFRGIFLRKSSFPAKQSIFDPIVSYVHILKAVHLRDKMGYLEALLRHPVRRKNFAGKLD